MFALRSMIMIAVNGLVGRGDLMKEASHLGLSSEAQKVVNVIAFELLPTLLSAIPFLGPSLAGAMEKIKAVTVANQIEY